MHPKPVFAAIRAGAAMPLAPLIAAIAVGAALAAAPPPAKAPAKPAAGKAPAAGPARRDPAALREETLRLNNLGIAYLAQFKAAEAEKQFKDALALNPSYLPGQVNVGIAALAQVHYDEAITAFRKALTLAPDNVHAHFNLSLIYKLQGKGPEALEEGLKALAGDGRDPDIHYHVGSLYLTAREFDKAIQELETVLKLDPNFLSAYYSLGRAWISKGDQEKGRQLIEKHRALQAGSAATPAVGLRYGEQGRYSYAMEDSGAAGPLAPLAAGAVTLVDASSAAGLDFTHAAGVNLAALGLSGSITTLAQLSGPEALDGVVAPMLGSGVAMADVDGDGSEDLFFANAGGDAPRPALFLNRSTAGAIKFSRPATEQLQEIGPALSAAFGDLDKDGDADLAISGFHRVLVLTNDGKGVFSDASVRAGVAGKSSAGVLGGISLADVDHDSDLDIYVAGFLASGSGAFPSGWPGGESLLFINATDPNQGLRFVESAAGAKVTHAGRRATGALFSDLDNDRDIDFALACPADGSTVYANQRDGTFLDLGAAAGLPGQAPILGLAAGDFTKDGWVDLAATTWDGGVPRLFRNMTADQPGRAPYFVLDVMATADLARAETGPLFGVAFVDFDLDGYLDLVAVNGGDTGPALLVYRNGGEGRYEEAGQLTGIGAIKARNGRGLAIGDLDRDGDPDFVISNAGGTPIVIRNDGGNKNHWIRVATAGLHSNGAGIGSKVEVKSGGLWQKLEVTAGSGYLSQSAAAPLFGLGARARVDVVRVLWPGGVLQDEIQQKADAVFAVKELDRKGSSCPILYADNGSGIGFVSDFLGGSAIGYRTGLSSFNTPDTDEYVMVRGDQLVPRHGALDLRMVNQLEETIYFDRARLLAVDHPTGVEILPDERLMDSPPFPSFKIHAVARTAPPAAAWDDSGRDLTQTLTAIDRLYAGPQAAGPGDSFKGYAPLHHLMLDLGDLHDGAPAVLLLHGWIDYADSTSNIAAAQAGLALVSPWLEALDETAIEEEDVVEVAIPGGATRRGRWTRVLPKMGFPAGLPKTMTVDLTGLLPPGARVIRIGTSMRIFWDQMRLATQLSPVPPTLTALEARAAVLRYRGFPALSSPDGRPPERYDYAADQGIVQWKSHAGGYTRYGDVRELLLTVDDRYVITRPGDEIALEFPAAGLPPLPEGWSRDYLLYADGFGKDMDINSSRPDTVEPLPYHGMASYPPPLIPTDPTLAETLLAYRDLWNTRRVGAQVPPIHTP